MSYGSVDPATGEIPEILDTEEVVAVTPDLDREPDDEASDAE